MQREQHTLDRPDGTGSVKPSAGDITSACHALDLAGRPLCVHSSLRSFGFVEGGAVAVVDGLLWAGCTVIVPTFSWCFAVPPPQSERPIWNGWDYDAFPGPTPGIGQVYLRDSVEIDPDMGAIPAEILARAGRIRGNHPICSFAAIGPRAPELISAQTPMNVWAPLDALADADGFVVLMGVGLAKMTLVHLAEQRAGRRPFVRWANGPEGQVMEVQVGGCSDGFESLRPVIGPLGRHTRVGSSEWFTVKAHEALEALQRAIREDPLVTHCADTHCERCTDAVRGGPICLRD